MTQDAMSQSIESAAFMWLTKRVIGDKKDPYLIRWIIIQTPWFSLYIHKLVRSDYERALHDHPWHFVSLVLRPYSEEIATPRTTSLLLDWHKEKHHIGSLLFRRADHRHRVIIENLDKPGWTIVLTGPRVRKWGFWPKVLQDYDTWQEAFKWCHWKKFNQELGICESEPISGRVGLD